MCIRDRSQCRVTEMAVFEVRPLHFDHNTHAWGHQRAKFVSFLPHVRGVSNKKQGNISLLATGLKLCRFFLYLPKNEKTLGDTSLELTAPLWSLRNLFFANSSGGTTLGENVSNKSCRAFDYLWNDISFINLASKLRRKSKNEAWGVYQFRWFLRILEYLSGMNRHGGIFEKNISDKSCRG